MQTSPPEIFDRIITLKRANESFVVATVISMRGSTAAKTGTKAIFDRDGKNQYGWVGGGCAESFLARESLAALQAREPRIVTVDLDDDVFGLMPCGGSVDVYLEPHFPKKILPIPNFGAWHRPISELLEQLGLATTVLPGPQGDDIKNWSDAFVTIVKLVNHFEDRPLRSLGATGESPRLGPNGQLIIVGRSRITEELARMTKLLDWNANVISLTDAEIPIPKNSSVLVASHNLRDNDVIAHALQSGADYVALVASPKRSGLIRADLSQRGLGNDKLCRLFAPAGLAFRNETPSQIAFSIIAEILLLQGRIHGH